MTIALGFVLFACVVGWALSCDVVNDESNFEQLTRTGQALVIALGMLCSVVIMFLLMKLTGEI